MEYFQILFCLLKTLCPASPLPRIIWRLLCFFWVLFCTNLLVKEMYSYKCVVNNSGISSTKKHAWKRGLILNTRCVCVSSLHWGNLLHWPLCMRLCRTIKHSLYGVVKIFQPVMNWYSVDHHPPCICVVRCLDKDVTDCPLFLVQFRNLCVQFGTEAVCFTFVLHGFACFNNLWLIM